MVRGLPYNKETLKELGRVFGLSSMFSNINLSEDPSVVAKELGLKPNETFSIAEKLSIYLSVLHGILPQK
ncbi:MAG: hypothetical protein Q8P80_03950 [Candidatus Levybacteria bacterium]|nr:hypothetical protein [Candidatus Levybacteria bacterium]